MSDRSYFRRTALRTRSANIPGYRVPRGGYRL